MVIKVGGSVIENENLQKNLFQDIVWMQLTGIEPIIVHGGGKHISSMMKKLGKQSQFIDGLRVTDKETMEITQMILAGLLSKDIVSMIQREGGKAVGFSGKDGNMVLAKKIEKNKIDYGYVGEIEKIDPVIINYLLEKNFIPVLSPIANSQSAQSLNINADLFAIELSIALKAEKVIFITDVKGILLEEKNEKTLIEKINIKKIKSLIKNKTISKGMIPKAESGIKAIEKGVLSVHIISGKIPHSLMIELFTTEGIGTQIIK